MKKDIQLIALDLDGTLYNNHSQISDKNKNTIHEAIASGITVIISTGRPYIGLPLDDLRQLGIQYAITSNGSAIYEIKDKTCLFEDGIYPEEGAALLEELYHHTLHLDAFINGDAYTQASTRPLIDKLAIPDSLRAYIRDTRTVVDDLADYVRKNQLFIQKLTINFLPGKDSTMLERDLVIRLIETYPGLHYVSGGFRNIEVNKTGISKAKGLRFLCDKLHIPMSATMACGDSQNDYDIVTAAGIGVAMANAEQILIDAADYVSLSNVEDGVSHAIQELVDM